MNVRRAGLTRAMIIAFLLSVFASFCFAEEGGGTEGGDKGKNQQQQPPAVVVVGNVSTGVAEPMAEYVGTVYYSRVSEVAAEVPGKVREVEYEEGRRVREGQVLVRLGTDLLDTQVESTRASFEQAAAELEKAEKDLQRMEKLYEEQTISQSLYEEHFYRTEGARQNALSLKADLERLKLEKEKKSINAPFSGIVVEKVVEPGEWVPAGGKVAVLADDRDVDVVVDVPEDILGYLKRGRRIEVSSGGKTLKGRFLSFMPRGDVATRTFSVKIRLRNTAGLVEGMEARAVIPSGAKAEGLLVPRDAVIQKFGMDVIFVVNDRKAKMIPVRITGYDGMLAGVEGPGLAGGMKVVVKGNERIMDGQPVMVKDSGSNSRGKTH